MAAGPAQLMVAKTAIVDNARHRLEPVIADTEKRVKAAQKEMVDAEQKIEEVKLDGTAALIDPLATKPKTEKMEPPMRGLYLTDDKFAKSRHAINILKFAHLCDNPPVSHFRFKGEIHV